LKFDGNDVSTMRDLPRLVATTPIGSDVDVEVLRRGQRTTLRVAVGRLIEQADPGKTSTKEPPKNKSKRREEHR
jgi:serine protease Do